MQNYLDKNGKKLEVGKYLANYSKDTAMRLHDICVGFVIVEKDLERQEYIRTEFLKVNNGIVDGYVWDSEGEAKAFIDSFLKG